MKKIIQTTLFLLFTLPFFAQNILTQFEEYQNSHHLEKIYIHHSKPFYTPGDTVWCELYFLDGRTHQFFEEASPIVHVEWYDTKDSLSSSYLLKIEEGTSAFEIPISYDALPGKYSIKAYTNYQRNFDPKYIFQKNIFVINDATQEKSKF